MPKAESFYNVNYGLSIIKSKVCQIISVMKTWRLVFPEKWYLKNSSFWHFDSQFLSWRQHKHHLCLYFNYWDYLTNFWRNNWRSRKTLLNFCWHNPAMFCLITSSKLVMGLNPDYRGSPTYTKITNTISTTTVFGLCTCKWGIFALVGDLLQCH